MVLATSWPRNVMGMPPSCCASSRFLLSSRCVAASMRVRSSSGVWMYTAYQGTLSRSAIRAVFRKSAGALGLRLESPTITRSVAESGNWSASARRVAAIDQVGDLGQRDLAQPRQVRRREEVLERGVDPLGRVDLARVEPLDQVFDGDVDVDDLVGLGEHAVGNALLHPDVRHALDLVVEAFEMLDVHRCDDVNARVEQVFDVLIALGVARAGRVGVGQLVDQADGRPPDDDRVDVHLAEGHAAVLDDAWRDDLEVADLLLRSRDGRESRPVR